MLPKSSLLFIVGLILAAATAIGSDAGWRYVSQSGQPSLDLSSQTTLLPADPRPLTSSDHSALKRAWAYFEKNTREETGLVDSVEGFASTTIWDQGSYLFALVAAEKTALISVAEFDERVGQFLTSMAALPLFEGRLPNKAYDTRSLQMVNYQNEVTERGIGWSALDVARLLLAFRTLEKTAPRFGADVRDILANWDVNAMADQGELWGTAVKDGQTVLRQEGRIGYEQYAARAAALWGLDALRAASAQRILTWKDVAGVEVPVDLRDATYFRAISPTLSEPFLLQALEVGFDSESRFLAGRVYQAQEARFKSTGVLTAVSEDHVNQDPYFLYASVFADGTPWAVTNEAGKPYPELRNLSVKASFGWHALYDTAYTAQLMAKVSNIPDLGRGWPAGIFETDDTINDAYVLNTNAVIIEALHFKAHGALWTTQ